MVSSFATYVFFDSTRPCRHTERFDQGQIARWTQCHLQLASMVLFGALLWTISGAIAADLEPYDEPAFDPVIAPNSLWAGPYLGFEAGPSQTATDVKANGRTEDLSRVDAAFGLFGGYNWEVSRFVLGVEGGATYLGGRERGTHPTLGNVEAGAKWTVSAKARAGLPLQNFMPYLSVGVAATEHSLKANGKERSSVSLGPVVGGGLEVALKDEWRLRADYSLTGIIDDTAKYGGTSVKRTSGNHRLMIGISRSF